MNLNFDVIVIGGGHAGTEAALAAARVGVNTLLVTQNIDTLGQMSCNPAIGGIGKGHLVKEIDALGGVMAKAADQAGIHFRTLNARKGPAVRATRAQTDRSIYKSVVRQKLENQANLSIFQQSVDDLLIEHDQVVGIKTQMGLKISAPTVVLTVGTFLGGVIHVGDSNYSGGRAGDAASNALATRLRALPFRVARLKTGTPPRLDSRSLDLSVMEVQAGENPIPGFSFDRSEPKYPRQINCFITRTNKNTHDIIRRGLSRSPMFNGCITGTGPRYCPSIEDKVMRFADRDSHQIFVEPEGLNVTEMYPNGVSTSLPFDVQLAFIRSIDGFSNAHITRPGYAIEYDFFDPRGLNHFLETRFVKGLYFAGQINGTTGYEEAAAQGLIAGLNAALNVKQEKQWCPGRSEAYIGVMIDDLVTLGTNEPYRMFTSRAEHRLLLREDNADLRLMEQGYLLGLVSEKAISSLKTKKELIAKEQKRMESLVVSAKTVNLENNVDLMGSRLKRDCSLLELLKRPEFDYQKVFRLASLPCADLPFSVVQQIEIQAKYSGYIQRQDKDIARSIKLESQIIPENMNFDIIPGLSNEVKQKLSEVKPGTVAQASRISGITPAAVSLLLVEIKKRSYRQAQ